MNTKPSMTLRFLEAHAVFTFDEFIAAVDPEVSERTRETNLRNAILRRQAYRITRALYTSNVGAYRDVPPSPLLVASKAAPGAVLAFHSALDAHGVAHSPARVATFLSSSRVTPFDVSGYRFRRGPDFASRAGAPDVGVTRARVGDTLVPVTSRERTLADCLKRLDLGGGLEEVLRSVGTFTTMSSAALSEYVVMLNSPTLAARVGWVMSLMAEAWLYDPKPLERLRGSLGRGTYWLQRRRSGVQYEFVAAWRLYVPAALPYQDWLRG